MSDDMAEMEIEDTHAHRAASVAERLRQLKQELEVNARLNAGMAQAAGNVAFDLPQDLMREIQEVRERMGKDESLTAADFPEDLRGDVAETIEQWDPEHNRWKFGQNPPPETNE